MIEGMVACITMLGGTCAFMYYMFNSMEKRIEDKLESRFERFEVKFSELDKTINNLIYDMNIQRARSDKLWEVLMSMTLEKKGKKSEKS